MTQPVDAGAVEATSLADKNAVITAAAGDIGPATARQSGKHEARVVAVAHPASDCTATKAGFTGNDGFTLLRADVSQEH